MKDFEPRVLTGDRPTGPLHLGHYVGSMQNRVMLQEHYKTLFYMVADVQAFTDNAENPQKVRDNVLEIVLDNLAVGIDPNKTTFFIQSLIPEIAELNVFFLNLVTLARLKRNPTVKNEMTQKDYGDLVPVGFLAYPVSQAADILFAKATLIPVGDDQIPQIEQTNEIREKFNRLYGEIFPEVKVLLSKTPRLSGVDGAQKASKSLGNAIMLSDPTDVVAQKVMSMFTDPEHIRVEDPGKVEGNVVFHYLDIFDSRTSEVEELKQQYKQGGLGDVILKKRLIEVLEGVIEPIRTRRMELAQDKSAVEQILIQGSEKAREYAAQTMQEVRKAMKIDYF